MIKIDKYIQTDVIETETYFGRLGDRDKIREKEENRKRGKMRLKKKVSMKIWEEG